MPPEDLVPKPVQALCVLCAFAVRIFCHGMRPFSFWISQTRSAALIAPSVTVSQSARRVPPGRAVPAR